MRLNQFLAKAGFGSRRSCEDLIREGRVVINGKVVTHLATSVSSSDYVKVDSKRVAGERPLTAILHKPAGFLCTALDPGKRPTIFDLLPNNWPRVFYVGRLDMDSEGLLLVTNDGALSQRLTHPKYEMPKTYEVQLDREFDFSLVPKLKQGIIIEGERAKMEDVFRLGKKVVKVVLTQGIKRQIRLMFEAVGFRVMRLIRTKMGSLVLGDLPPGHWRILTETEIRNHFERPVVRPSAASGSGVQQPGGEKDPRRPRRAPVRPAIQRARLKRQARKFE